MSLGGLRGGCMEGEWLIWRWESDNSWSHLRVAMISFKKWDKGLRNLKNSYSKGQTLNLVSK